MAPPVPLDRLLPTLIQDRKPSHFPPELSCKSFWRSGVSKLLKVVLLTPVFGGDAVTGAALIEPNSLCFYKTECSQ